MLVEVKKRRSMKEIQKIKDLVMIFQISVINEMTFDKIFS